MVGALLVLCLVVYLAILKAPAGAILGGYVVDAETGELLPGVTLTVVDGDTLDRRGMVRTSDPQGRFRFDGLRPGLGSQVWLVARKDGYQPSTDNPPLGATNHPIKLHSVAKSEDHQ